MGSGNWIKTMINLKKGKNGHLKQLKASSSPSVKSKNLLNKGSAAATSANNGHWNEELAATRIQTAFRAYKARKALRRLRGTVKLQSRTKHQSIVKQATATLNHLHLWSSLQTQIRNRRLFMVTEGRSRQKRLENQLKLESKLHDLVVEWNSGCDTMEEILAKVHQREEAAVKRERAMAYAFSHQWRANCSQSLGSYEVGKSNWGWSWIDRWIAARPWESRVPVKSITPKKGQQGNKQANKASKNATSTAAAKTPAAAATTTTTVSKPPMSNGAIKARRLTYPVTGKQGTTLHGSRKGGGMGEAKKEQLVLAS